MEYHQLELCGLTRQLPIVPLGPKLKIASFNLLGDGELVEKAADSLAQKLKRLDFDYLVGPEVRVVPLLQALSTKLNKPRHIVLRKNIMGYMTRPVSGKNKPTLVLNGPDAQILKGKKVLMIDDVISTGRTLKVVRELMDSVGARVVGIGAILKQGENKLTTDIPFIFLGKLPLFKKDSP